MPAGSLIKVLARPWAMLALFGAASLAAVLTGAWVCAASGVPAGSWLRNLAAWMAGAVAAIGLATAYRPLALTVALWAAPLGLAAAFLSPGQQGVHRWIDLGPVHLNAAMLLLPAAIVALAAKAQGRRWPWLAALICLCLLVAQPDASQAATLATAAVLIAAMAVRPLSNLALVYLTATVIAGLTWLRSDPLQPVPEVEQIVSLALSVSALAAGLAVALLGAVAAAPAFSTLAAPPTARLAGRALGVTFLMWALTPILGAFPVPFVGVGMSPIVGGWLAIGLLAGLLRNPAATP